MTDPKSAAIERHVRLLRDWTLFYLGAITSADIANIAGFITIGGPTPSWMLSGLIPMAMGLVGMAYRVICIRAIERAIKENETNA